LTRTTATTDDSSAADRRFTLAESQALSHYTSNGRSYPRIAYGDDDARWGAIPCRGCGAVKGQHHTAGDCPYEHCPVCRASQLGTCPHRFVELGTDGTDASFSGPTVGDRILAAVLGGVILLCVVATVLAALRVL
jgi:hypothetical protein